MLTEAQTKLKSDCHKWDCSNVNQQQSYPEYWELNAFFTNTIAYLKSGLKMKYSTIQTMNDLGELLKLNFLKESFSSLQNSIFNLGDKVIDIIYYLYQQLITITRPYILQ